MPSVRCGLLLSLAWALCAAEVDEFKVKREEVFEFAQKPRLKCAGDRVEISFESKGWCDVTIAIEDARGNIVRHLASGVLGPKAPEHFQKDSKKQIVVWDGKDDQEKYRDDKDKLSVRVSLGLKPQFERSLLWDPRRRQAHGTSYGADSDPAPLVAAAPEGVYVLDGGGTALDHLRLFDHEGNYIRTVYPFPADKIKAVSGLHWHTYPQDGQSLPLKPTFMQNTMLTSGDSWAPTYNIQKKVFHTNGHKETAHFGMHGSSATAMAVANGRIALAHHRLARLGTDGTSGGMALSGPPVAHGVKIPMTYAGPGGPFQVSPRSAALSPDGQWVYLTNYIYHKNLVFNGLHGVVRAPMDDKAGGNSEVWLGTMDRKTEGAPSNFHHPSAVACDSKGDVYVADYMNDRIQVFDSAGKFVRSIASAKPAHLAFHHATGDLYVFSWLLTNQDLKVQAHELGKKQQRLSIPAVLTVLAPGESKPKAEFALPFEKYESVVSSYYASGDGLRFRVTLDSWTDPPTIWMVPTRPDWNAADGWAKSALRLLTIKDGKLVVKRDFGTETAQFCPVSNGRQRLFVNPATGKLYADPGGMQFGLLWEIDPGTGDSRKLDLPLVCEDMAFDYDGYIYLKTNTELVRFELPSWRQIPFDYGEERSGGKSGKPLEIISCLPLPANSGFHQGGMHIAPNGNIAVGCLYMSEAEQRQDEKKLSSGAKPYKPRIYPGRSTGYNYGAIYAHVWDKRGQLRYEDAIPGMGGGHGIAIDNTDNLYVSIPGTRVLDGTPYFNDAAGTLIKFKPKAGRLLSSAKVVPVPLTPESRPNRAPDLEALPGPSWVEGSEWMYGGVGHDGKKWVGCSCWNSRIALDVFGRSFAPEIDRYKVAVLDTSGNLILRVGSYGNVDDGKPLEPAGGPPNLRSLGGDEVSLMHGAYVATHSDRRLFIADPGNARIVSVKLGYYAEERLALKEAARE